MSAVNLRFSDAHGLGFKGPQATAFAATLGPLPELNGHSLLIDGSALLRLGHHEYLVDAADEALLAPWRERLRATPAGVVEVPHQDIAVDLSGPGLRALLRQTCALDLAAPGALVGRVVLTQVIGVPVIVTSTSTTTTTTTTAAPAVRLLFDPTWRHYMAQALRAMAEELNANDGGGA